MLQRGCVRMHAHLVGALLGRHHTWTTSASPVTDPLLRRRIGPLHNAGHLAVTCRDRTSSTWSLLSHLHRDHTDLASLARFPAVTRVVVPAGGAALLRRKIRATVQELDADETAAFGSVTVRAVYADHDGRRGFGGP